MWLIIGVSGVTCGGKSTLARALRDALPNAQLLCQDDYFLPVDSERHTWITQLNHINWEIMSALDMDKMWQTICKILAEIPSSDNSASSCKETITGSDNQASNNSLHILIIEGFLILNYHLIAEICQLKYHLTLNKEQCLQRRSVRTYNPPDVPGFFELCIWPEYEKHKQEMLCQVHGVKVIDGSGSMQAIIQDVLNEVKETVAKTHSQ